jgi:hypothetical protein
VSVQGVDRLVSGDISAAVDYLDLQRRLISRGVTIERIFVYDRRDSSLLKMMDEHRKAGIRVFEVSSRGVPDDLKIDCAIVDMRFFGRVDVGSTGKIVGTYYAIAQSEVDRRIRGFAELKSLASEYV